MGGVTVEEWSENCNVVGFAKREKGLWAKEYEHPSRDGAKLLKWTLELPKKKVQSSETKSSNPQSYKRIHLYHFK